MVVVGNTSIRIDINPVLILGLCDLIPGFYESIFIFFVMIYIAGIWLEVNNHLR